MDTESINHRQRILVRLPFIDNAHDDAIRNLIPEISALRKKDVEVIVILPAAAPDPGWRNDTLARAAVRRSSIVSVMNESCRGTETLAYLVLGWTDLAGTRGKVTAKSLKQLMLDSICVIECDSLAVVGTNAADKFATFLADKIDADALLFFGEDWGFYIEGTTRPYAFVKEIPSESFWDLQPNANYLSAYVAFYDRAPSIRAFFEEKGTGRAFLIKRPSRRKLRLSCLPLASGHLVVDSRAKEAISSQGASLLPAGIIQVVDCFGDGEMVRICDERGKEFARGITNYSSREVAWIKGHHSHNLKRMLGAYSGKPEVIHRNEMILTADLLLPPH